MYNILILDIDPTETLALADLQTQVSQISKQNLQLKNKVQFFKSLHEAEVRKRAPYDHIPPRVNTGNQRKLYPALKRKTSKAGQNISIEVEQDSSEDVQKLYYCFNQGKNY